MHCSFKSAREHRKPFASEATAPPSCPVVQGDWLSLPQGVRRWARAQVELCTPRDIHIVDGSIEEDAQLKKQVPIPVQIYLTLSSP